MNIAINAALKDLTCSDLDNLNDSLDRIDEACLQTKQSLQEDLLVKAELHRQWWNRFIDYCRTGK
jgi:hypothetical protein